MEESIITFKLTPDILLNNLSGDNISFEIFVFLRTFNYDIIINVEIYNLTSRHNFVAVAHFSLEEAYISSRYYN